MAICANGFCQLPIKGEDGRFFHAFTEDRKPIICGVGINLRMGKFSLRHLVPSGHLLYGSQSIDTSNPRDVTLSFGQLDGSLLKDTTDVGRQQIRILVEHQGNNASQAWRCL